MNCYEWNVRPRGGACAVVCSARWAVLSVLVAGCHGAAQPGVVSPGPASEPSSQESRVGVPNGESPAARYCGAVQPSVQIGALVAQPIAGSEPTALSAADTEFHLYEGAVWLDDALYFSDFKTTPGFPSRILRYQPGGTLSVFVEDSGTNGLGLDPTGSRLVGARHKSKSVVVLDATGAVERHVAQTYQGLPFNSPNDVVFRSDGTLFFTDPDFQAGEHKDQATTNVYRVDANGSVSIVDAEIQNPNGIALSLDERTLYVAGNLEAGYLKSYPLDEAGQPGPGHILVDGIAVPDGLSVDCSGNIYVTEHLGRRVRIVHPDGTHAGEISGLQHNVTNVAFGGAERKTLFITTTGALYSVELPVSGLPY